MPEGRRAKRHVLPPRARVAVRIVVTGVVVGLLALVVGVVVNLMQPAPVVHEPTGATTAPGQADYLAGIDALASGDTTKATELLSKAAAAGNPTAKAKLDDVSKPASTTPSVPASDTYLAGVSDMATLLPVTVEGYAMSEVETDGPSAIVSAEPVTPGQQASISRIAFTVYDKITASRAKTWLSRFATAYPRNVARVTVGDVSGKFGTDGAHLASVAFVRGRYTFEVVATAVRGNPKDLKSLVIQAAEAFSAAHVTD